MRTITGFIARRNSRAFRINTPVATIGIRGTTFDARLCDGDCKADAEAAKGKPVIRSQAIGRVAFVKGMAISRKRDTDFARPIEAGSPLYEGDTVSTSPDSYAVLIFKDRSRVTLRANTVFEIQALKYAEDKAEEDSSVFRLVRGGLRAVTGFIGRRNANRVRYRTAVATIGIRGTGFDLVCIDACGAGESRSGEETSWNLEDFLVPKAQAADEWPVGAGLLATPWRDAIVAIINQQEYEIGEGQIFFIPLSLIPIELLQMPFEITEPLPDDVDIDDTVLGAGEGLYVGEDGEVIVTVGYAPPVLTGDSWFNIVDLPADEIDQVFPPSGGGGGRDECTFAQ